MKHTIDEVNSALSDSFHNWNTNSSWFSLLVVATRARSLLLTLDKMTGKATKPFLLPQRNPRHYQQSMYSYNTPDFASRVLDAHPRETATGLLGKNRVATQTKDPKGN